MPRTLPLVAPVPFAADLARHGDRVAVLTDRESITYADLAGRVADVGARLGSARRLVLLAAGNDVHSLVVYLAALAGGHPVLLTAPSAAHALAAAYDPDVVAHDGALTERRPGTRHTLHPDLALLLSTSGSTGSPKLVRLSAENLQSNAEAIATYLGIRESDRAATTLPIHYCYGLSVVNSHLLRGAGIVLTDLSVVDPCFWDLARSRGVTAFAGVPHTFELLDRVGFADMDLPDLRYVTQAGGRLAPEKVRRFAELGRRRGWDLFVMYGQTEATARMAYLPPDLAATRPETIGVPVPGGSFRIDHGEAGDDVGELVYAGPNVMLGYAETPADLALGRTVTELRTGDLARQHPDGLYEVVGRRSRFVKVVGLRIDLGRVERLLGELGVTAACAGTDGRLVVAVEGRHDTARLTRVVSERLGVPRAAVHVLAVRSLPRLASGKPDYGAVLATAPRPASATTPAPGAESGNLRDLFAELLDRPDATDDDTFVSLGGDSLSYVEVSVRLEEVLGHLPTDWHVTPIRELQPRPRRRWRPASVETGVALRAVAIVLIVGTHAKLFDWPGAAHVLMAVAGYNFARFQLVGHGLPRLRRQLRSAARIVVPSVAFIAVAYLLTDTYSAANVVLLNAIVGPPTWTTQWHFWFVEVLVYVLVAMSALLAVPWAAAAERRFRFGFPLALTSFALLGRFEVVDVGVPHTKPVLWLFALGWATAQARGPWQRLAVSAVAVLAVPGFFGDPRRDWLIVAGLLLLVWVPSLPTPARLGRVAAVLAAASLHVYLTQWLVYPELDDVSPALALVASLAAGVGYWWLSTHLGAHLGPPLRTAITRVVAATRSPGRQ